MVHRLCLVVSDGRRGIENQALGLAEAIQKHMPLDIRTLHLNSNGDDGLSADPGAIWIGCGRAAVEAAPRHRKILPDCVFAYIQNPRKNQSCFDLIIAPHHDRVTGQNVFPIIGSTNRITDQTLAEGAQPFQAKLEAMSGPKAAFLIGGQSKRHGMNKARCSYLLDRIEQVLNQGVSAMITVSRRTPRAFRTALKERFQNTPNIWLHDDQGPNPYFAFLAGADWIFVTEDSTNMLTEASSTGKPVYRLTMDGEPGKFRSLYAALEGVGAVRPYLGQLDHWSYTKLHETARAADQLLEILARSSKV